ncbi:MAG: 5-formyltetrahydrofolate cyclo-ligase, partial [Nocardioides sp.]|uniref:5-formyltetrahydrofolate cyclo-ligase n=1 Tax=Nocardioides sp. TaxID=35761 RepID=UPI0039E23914
MPHREPHGGKIASRDQFLTRRRRLGLSEIGDAAQRLAAVALAHPAVRRAATVAAYVSVGSEPGTGVLLDALRSSGRRVILPLLQPDDDLDWALDSGDLVRARRGLLEPTGPPLGADAIAGADLVLVPGLAVSPRGDRLGRG